MKKADKALLDATPSDWYSLWMKFDVLRSIGHNMADSLASGVSMLTGLYCIDPFAEAKQSPNGFIHVNFLTGTSNSLSSSFQQSMVLFGEALPGLCRKHGTSPAVFRRLEATYFHDPSGRRFVVIVEDQRGQRSTDDYAGQGERLRVLDPVGRIRRKRGPVIKADREREERSHDAG